MKLNVSRLLEMVRTHQTYSYKGADPSFRELARLINVSPSTFTRMHSNKAMSAETLIRIVDWLWRIKGHDADIILGQIIVNPVKPKTRKTA